jgi:hypothetical protein
MGKTSGAGGISLVKLTQKRHHPKPSHIPEMAQMQPQALLSAEPKRILISTPQ